MMRRRPRHYSYSIQADDAGRDLRIFISSLVIGICIGAFGLYFWLERPHSRQIALLQAELAAQANRSPACNTRRSATLEQRDELESRLSTCEANLSRTRRQAETVLLPPPPKPQPDPAPPATAVINAAPSPLTPPAVIPTPDPSLSVTLPPAPLTPPPGWPPLPGLPPASQRISPAPASPDAPPQPAPPSSAPEPVAVAVPSAPENAVPALQPPSPPAPWPVGFPPQPRPRPPVPPAQPVEAAPASIATSPLPALTDTESATLNVGDEQSFGSGHKLRLVAVSRRNTGRYCVLAGNDMDGVRLASGSSQRITWGRQRVSISATVEDNDSCRVSVRPAH